MFAHFPQKEALVFDEDDEQRDRLVSAVRGRSTGVTINKAIHDFYAAEIAANLDEHGDDVAHIFLRFLNETPALRDYASKMWLRHEDALAEAIADELDIPAPTPRSACTRGSSCRCRSSSPRATISRACSTPARHSSNTAGPLSRSSSPARGAHERVRTSVLAGRRRRL